MSTTSIDYAVSGFVRHRFVRALWSSLFVAVTTWTVVSWLQSGFFSGSTQEFSIGTTLLAAPFFLMFIAMLVFAVKFAVDAVQGTHRRLTALLLVAGWAYLFYLFAMQLPKPIVWQGEDIGWDVATYTPAQMTGAAATMVLRLAGVIVAVEAFSQALWQLTIDRERFLAARGWRPKSSVGNGSFRRSLGLPGFVSMFQHGGTRLALIYYLIALINVALLAAPLSPFWLESVQAQWGERAVLYAAGAALVLIVVLIVAGWALDRFAERFATKMYQGVRDWDERAPVVFLRTFDQDDNRLRVRALDPIARLPAGIGRSRTMDELLLEHASPYGPVIAIGDPRDSKLPLGAARIFVPGQGQAWQEWVRGIAEASKAIVMCPNDTEGVRWELELLAHGDFAHRLVYLANPELPKETNARLFASFAPGGAGPEIRRGQIPIAAFTDPENGWRVITARGPSLEAYAIGLNLALQRLFGLAGVPIGEEVTLIDRATVPQLVNMGEEAMKKRDYPKAMAAYQKASQYAAATGETQAEAERLTLMAEAALQIGRVDIASPAILRAQEIYAQAPDSPRTSLAHCAKAEALLREAENRHEEARAAWTRARDIYAQAGDRKQAAACAAKLR